MSKSWLEKYNSVKSYQIKTIDKKFADMPVGTKMLIATPKIIDEYIKQIPFGVEVNLKRMILDLASEFKAEMTCPVTSGIYLRIVSELAFEKHLQGVPLDEVTPFWRVITTKSPLASKLSFGVEFIRKQREFENLS